MSTISSSAAQVILRDFSTADLMQELCTRGALKVLERQEYLPGHVIVRYRGHDAVTRVTAEAISRFTRDLLNEKVLSITTTPATESGYPDAPPNDVVIAVSLLVPNPSYDEPTDV